MNTNHSQSAKRTRSETPGSSPSYTSKIIKAGALLPDTKTVLSNWDLNLSVKENLQRVRRQNLLGKTSRSRLEDILRIFRQRYMAEEDVLRALIQLMRSRCNANTVERVLYFHAVRADALLRDVLLGFLVPRWLQGRADIAPGQVEGVLHTWVQQGKTSGLWGDYTIRRVAIGVLSTLRDFGVLRGAVNKRIVPPFVSPEAFSYVAFYLQQHPTKGIRLLDLDDWRLFFLTPEGVERFLLEGHQRGLLEYQAAGSTTRLVFPASTLEEYINVVTDGTAPRS